MRDLHEQFTQYCEARLREIELSCAHEVLQSVYRQTAKLCQDLGAIREQLNRFRDAYACEPEAIREQFGEPQEGIGGLTEVLPARTTTLLDAAQAVVGDIDPRALTKLDKGIQLEVLISLGGLWSLGTGAPEALLTLKRELQNRAQVAVLGAMTNVDSASLLLAHYGNEQLTKEALVRSVQSAAPRFQVAGSWRHLLLATPAGAVGTSLRNMLINELTSEALTPVESDGDLVFCYEAARLSARLVAAAIIDHDPAYLQVARKIMTRTDIPWTELKIGSR